MINKRQIFNYNLSLKILARKNRNNPTKPELVFWNEILKNKFTSYKFLRQKPIGDYILDFYCSKLLLAIEVDGSSHYQDDNYDNSHTEYLNSLGIKVLRYLNNEVMNNIAGIYLDIIKQIKIREKELL